MPKTSLQTVEALVNRALKSIQGIERRWRGLTPDQRTSIVKSLDQAMGRLEDANNRDDKFKLPE
jgi:hypothetical protein